MSTWNGCGTTLYGWKHDDDGTATATWWIVALMFPVFPLKRVRLRIFTPADDRLLNLSPVVDHYEVLEVLERDMVSIIRTYVSAYLLFPLALMLPYLLLGLGIAAARLLGQKDPAIELIMPVFVVFNIVYWIGLGLFVLRRSRGRRAI